VPSWASAVLTGELLPLLADPIAKRGIANMTRTDPVDRLVRGTSPRVCTAEKLPSEGCRAEARHLAQRRSGQKQRCAVNDRERTARPPA
jgi:hypothetical protein